jgi:hypothetical protein
MSQKQARRREGEATLNNNVKNAEIVEDSIPLCHVALLSERNVTSVIRRIILYRSVENVKGEVN